MTDKLRIFYRKADGFVVWTHALEGAGEFPVAMEEELQDLPNAVITVDPVTKVVTLLGGKPEAYDSLQIDSLELISAIQKSDGNKVIGNNIIAGPPRIVPPTLLPRDLFEEIDRVKADIKAIKTKLEMI